ncbi:hypothetical protein QSJ18_03265 [Gordonia sp. ABSL1-1]|uniref:hypothetical protein n=1 Tax=Gordonia sp. ABSL1-1 TaxID=3053923 RepID=UPI002572F802|nr:hypothetical protein [Gordonia sp. ABSL1-1]MDL9935756.1 hypothetical protein [Gordonia sp. ABSL1-1]
MKFEGRSPRNVGDDLLLAELPAWGLEMMMGLYGPDTIKQACDAERADGAIDPDAELAALLRTESRRRTVVAPAGRAESASAMRMVVPATDPAPADRPVVGYYDGYTPVNIELEAMNALVRYITGKFRKH